MWQRQSHHEASITGTRWEGTVLFEGGGPAVAAWQPAAEAVCPLSRRAGSHFGLRTAPTPKSQRRCCNTGVGHLRKDKLSSNLNKFTLNE